MERVSEVKRWIETLDDDNFIAVDDGGLALVELRCWGQTAPPEETGASYEIGGIPILRDYDNPPGISPPPMQDMPEHKDEDPEEELTSALEDDRQRLREMMPGRVAGTRAVDEKPKGELWYQCIACGTEQRYGETRTPPPRDQRSGTATRVCKDAFCDGTCVPMAID